MSKGTIYCLYDDMEERFLPETLHVTENDDLEFWRMCKQFRTYLENNDMHPSQVERLSSVPIAGIDLERMCINPDDVFRNELVVDDIWPDNVIPFGTVVVNEFGNDE